jgi:hypothetical protein
VCACLLFNPFQLYLEMEVIFCLSICTASAKNYSVGNGNMLLEFWGDAGGGSSQYGLSASNCREDENEFLSPCRKMSFSSVCLLQV